MATFTLRDGAGGLPPPHDTHAYEANVAPNDTQQASVFTERAAARGYDRSWWPCRLTTQVGERSAAP
jgi:hypothetical protein